MEEIVRQTALIDWFRFTCPWDLDPDGPDGDSLTLLSLLRVDPGKVTVPRTNLLGRLNYARTVVYGEDVGVGLDPSESARMRGIRSQFIVDLPGSACRHFEARGGSWKDLISYLCSVPGVRFNRIDLALDDIDGELDVESLRRKVSDQRFVSAFRGRKRNGRVGDETYSLAMPEEDDLGGPRVIDSRKGYTVTFGARNQPVMLNIYDKLAERESRGLVPGVREWIRFEASFIREKCESCVRRLVLPSLEAGTFGRTVAGIVRGLIEFKEGSGYDRDGNNHINRLPIWRSYSRFLRGAAAIRVPSDQARVEESVNRTLDWAKGYWRSSLVKLFGCADLAMGQVAEKVAEDIRRNGIPWQLVEQVLSYSRSKGRPLTVDQALDNVQTYLDTFGGDVDVRKAFEERLERDRRKASGSTRFLQDLELGEDDLPDPGGKRAQEGAMLDAFDLEGIL